MLAMTSRGPLAGRTLPPWHQAPRSTGWPSNRAPSQGVDFVGSFVPFAKTAEERRRSGDPRLSLEERYPSKAAYLTRYENYVRALASQRFLLDKDIPVELKRGEEFWDFAHREADAKKP